MLIDHVRSRPVGKSIPCGLSATRWSADNYFAMCQMLQEVYCVFMDPQSIIDRVKMLTEEIAATRSTPGAPLSYHLNDQRRERLEQILGELASLVSQERKAS